MAWNPAVPATNADLLSAPVRDNFAALDTQIVAPFVALANGQVLVKSAGVLAGVPAGTNGYLLTLVGGVPLWQPAPTGVAYPLLAPDGSPTAPSYSFASNTGHGLAIGPGGHLYLVAAGGSTLLVFNRGATTSWFIDVAHGWQPGVDAAYDIGAVATAVRNLFALAVTHRTGAAPGTPSSGYVVTYAKSDKKMYAKDDAGLETALGGGAGGAAAFRLPIEQATLPDGSAGNVPPELVREKSTGTLANAPSPTRTYARFAGDAAAVDEHLLWSFMLPANWGSGGTLRLKWKAAVATTGNVIWKSGAAPVTDGSTDDDAVAFSAVTVAAASAAPATQGQSVEVAMALTTTGFAAGRWVTVFIGRDADNAADTMTGTTTAGDAILMGVQFEYTPA
jgi:hypothetical protein